MDKYPTSSENLPDDKDPQNINGQSPDEVTFDSLSSEVPFAAETVDARPSSSKEKTSRLAKIHSRIQSAYASAKESIPLDVSTQYQTALAERLDFHTGDPEKDIRNIRRFQKLIRSGKPSLDNEIVAQKYMFLEFAYDYSMDKTRAIEKLRKAGIAPERIARYVVDSFIEQSTTPKDEQEEKRPYSGFSFKKPTPFPPGSPPKGATFSLANVYYATKDIDDPNLMERLRECIERNNLAEKFTKDILDEAYKFRGTPEEINNSVFAHDFSNAKNGILLLDKLGIESPLHQNPLPLFKRFTILDGYSSGKEIHDLRQEAAFNTGLINEEDVDNLYHMVFNHQYAPSPDNISTKGPIGRRIRRRITLDDLEDVDFTISPNLPTSGNDDLAEFYKNNQALGSVLTSISNRNDSMTGFLAREWLTKGNKDYEIIFDFFKAHPNYLKGGDCGLMISLENIPQPEDDTDRTELHDYIRNLNSQTVNRHFDKSGATPEFYADILCSGAYHTEEIFKCLTPNYEEAIASNPALASLRLVAEQVKPLQEENELPSALKRLPDLFLIEDSFDSDGHPTKKLIDNLYKDALTFTSDESTTDFYCSTLPNILEGFTFDQKQQTILNAMRRIHLSNSEEIARHANSFIDALSLSEDASQVEEQLSAIENLFLYPDLPYLAKIYGTFLIMHPPDKLPTEFSNFSEHEHRASPVLMELADKGNGEEMAGVLYSDLFTIAAGSNNHSLREKMADNPRIIAYMDQKIAETDSHNREATKHPFRFQRGDLLKGLGGVQYLHYAMQNGFVCKEFLGPNAQSDTTPLDTDLSLIEKDGKTIEEAAYYPEGQLEATAFGPLWMVLKADENREGPARFINTNRAPAESDRPTDDTADRSKIEVFHTGRTQIGIQGRTHMGIRTGFASSEIDFFVAQNADTANATKNEIVMNGFYIPIVDYETNELIFTPEEYDQMRERMRGLKEYSDERFRFADEDAWYTGSGEQAESLVPSLNISSYTLPNGNTIPSTAEIVALAEQNATEVATKREAIVSQIIMPVLEEMGLSYKDYLDGDLTSGSAEVIDTGSTGRLVNLPDSGDFDFMMKIDREILTDGSRMAELCNRFRAFGLTGFLGGNVRTKGVALSGVETPVDIDITFSQKTDKVRYSTDVALSQWYDSVESASPEKTPLLKANIIFAKEFLKGIDTYKSSHSNPPQGGLGGVGIENWILQHGGSFVAAAIDFMRTANQCQTFQEFKDQYAVWDFGENHKNGKHDNFVANNMDSSGYEHMKLALADFLDSQGISY